MVKVQLRAHRTALSDSRIGRAPIKPACKNSCAAHLRLLGGFELIVGDQVVAPSLIGQRILALLALRDRPTTRSYIAGNLWPDHAEEKAAGSLRSALWRLKAIGDDLIACEHSTLALGPSVSVDVQDLLDQSRELLECHPGAQTIPLDLQLFCRDLLPDWYDDWVFFERERLRHLRLASLERLATRMLESGDLLAAICAGTAAVAGEALRESAHRVLVMAHISTGNYSEAIRQYQTYAVLLHKELGLRPSPLMDELVAPLMRR